MKEYRDGVFNCSNSHLNFINKVFRRLILLIRGIGCLTTKKRHLPLRLGANTKLNLD